MICQLQSWKLCYIFFYLQNHRNIYWITVVLYLLILNMLLNYLSTSVVKGSCGPCPVEALRKGDLGQKDDVDAFFSSMDAYVRYFYEDEESGWGYSPFNQFKWDGCIT